MRGHVEFVAKESSLTFLRDESPSWSHNSLSRNHSDSLFCVDVPVNIIGDSGATALVEALKEMRNLEKLDLCSEFWAVVISRCDAMGIEVL